MHFRHRTIDNSKKVIISKIAIVHDKNCANNQQWVLLQERNTTREAQDGSWGGHVTDATWDSEHTLSDIPDAIQGINLRSLASLLTHIYQVAH